MSEFDSLIDIEPVSHVIKVPDWEGEIPHQVLHLVTKALETGKIYPVPANSSNGLRLKSALKAGVAKLAPDKSAQLRDKYSKDAEGKSTGELVGFSFSIGERRGRKVESA